MLNRGERLQDRYTIEDLVATGGMGAVYRAKDERLGGSVALKQTFSPHEDYLRRAFEREARILHSLKHAALPKVTDFFSEGGAQFLVMEFIPGDDLAELMAQRGGAFDVDEVLPWAERLLNVLQYLHAQKEPVIHRDIKPLVVSL